jgi:hypothetical protein
MSQVNPLLVLFFPPSRNGDIVHAISRPYGGEKALDRLQPALRRLLMAYSTAGHLKGLAAVGRAPSATEAQRDFVLWWDKQGSGQGSRTDRQHRNGPVTKLIAGRGGTPDRMTISRCATLWGMLGLWGLFHTVNAREKNKWMGKTGSASNANQPHKPHGPHSDTS